MIAAGLLAACTPPYRDLVPPATLASRTAIASTFTVAGFEAFRAAYPGLCNARREAPTGCFISGKVYGRPVEPTDPGTWEYLALIRLPNDVLCHFRASEPGPGRARAMGSVLLRRSGEADTFAYDSRYFDTRGQKWQSEAISACLSAPPVQ